MELAKQRREGAEHYNNKHKQCNAIYLPQKRKQKLKNTKLLRNRREQIFIIYKFTVLMKMVYLVFYYGWWWLKRRQWWWRWWYCDSFVFYHRWMHTHRWKEKTSNVSTFHFAFALVRVESKWTHLNRIIMKKDGDNTATYKNNYNSIKWFYHFVIITFIFLHISMAFWILFTNLKLTLTCNCNFNHGCMRVCMRRWRSTRKGRISFLLHFLWSLIKKRHLTKVRLCLRKNRELK